MENDLLLVKNHHHHSYQEKIKTHPSSIIFNLIKRASENGICKELYISDRTQIS